MRHETRFLGKLLLSAFLLSIIISPVTSAYSAVEYPVNTATKWQVGVVVALNDDGQPVHASTKSGNYIGVVTAVNDHSIEVANTGTVWVFVTNESGSIAVGSRVHVSAVSGVASTEFGGETVGVVRERPTKWDSAQVQSGGNDSVEIGVAQVQLVEQAAGASSTNPFIVALQKTGNGIAGHTVDVWRTVTALLVGLGGLILSFGLLFISSRESFFSMGRNPMAGTAIMRGLWKVVALSVIIMCASLGTAYFILRVG